MNHSSSLQSLDEDATGNHVSADDLAMSTTKWEGSENVDSFHYLLFGVLNYSLDTSRHASLVAASSRRLWQKKMPFRGIYPRKKAKKIDCCWSKQVFPCAPEPKSRRRTKAFRGAHVIHHDPLVYLHHRDPTSLNSSSFRYLKPSQFNPSFHRRTTLSFTSGTQSSIQARFGKQLSCHSITAVSLLH